VAGHLGEAPEQALQNEELAACAHGGGSDRGAVAGGDGGVAGVGATFAGRTTTHPSWIMRLSVVAMACRATARQASCTGPSIESHVEPRPSLVVTLAASHIVS